MLKTNNKMIISLRELLKHIFNVNLIHLSVPSSFIGSIISFTIKNTKSNFFIFDKTDQKNEKCVT
jgi:hypothetical protein